MTLNLAVWRAHPDCCDTPMIHNSGGGEYVCADAFLGLLHDGAVDETGHLLINPDRLNPHGREQHDHWQTSRIPDGTPWPQEKVTA